MEGTRDKKKINIKELFLSFTATWFVLMLGRGAPLFASIDPRSTLVGTAFFFLILGGMYLYAPRPKISRQFIILFTVASAFTAVHFIVDSDFQYFLYFQFLCFIFAGYLAARVFGTNLTHYVVKAVYRLSVIALAMWLIELAVSPTTLGKIAPFPNTYGKDGGSFLFYTVLDFKHKSNYFMGLVRNSGFAWEPGRFASILAITLTLNTIRNKGKFSIRNRTNLVLSLALASTFSTTGYVAFFLLVGLNILSGKKISLSTKVISGVLVGLLAYGCFSLPFMSEKIKKTMDVTNFVSFKDLKWLSSQEEMWTVDRAEGLFLDAINFSADPVFGYGLAHQDQFIYENLSEYLVTSNGLVKPLAQYGIVFWLPFIILFFKSTKKYSVQSGYRGKSILFIILLTVSVSYSFEADPLIRALTMFAAFTPQIPTKKRKRIKIILKKK